MQKTLVSLTAATLLVAAPMAQATPVDPLEPFLVFGDSLSDAGFFGGQASNGDTWAAQLGATTETGNPTYNFAQGGARAVTTAGPPADLDDQIDSFQAMTPFLRPETHAVVWLGGNDLLAATGDVFDGVLDGSIDLTTQQGQDAAAFAIGSAVGAAVGSIGSGIQRLAAPGPDRIANFVVPGLPAFGLLPAFENAPAPLVAAATGASTLFNQELQNLVTGLDALPGLNVAFVDVDAIFAAVIAGSPGNGFTDLQGNCVADNATPACTGYVFWDDIHPTGATHSVLAGALAERLPAPIPLPAGLLLALGGLGALGALRATRKA